MKNNGNSLIQEEIKEATEKFRGLSYIQDAEGFHVVAGLLWFSATFNSRKIEDEFSVEIKLSDFYPKFLPEVKETGGRIPSDFHQHSDDTLCLGSPLDIRLKFSEEKTFIGYIERLVVPYLYSFSYFEKYDEMPFGELSHGGLGIVEFYKEFFKVSSAIYVLKFLQLLYENKLKGHHFCPCNSDQRLRNCHGPQLHKIKGLQSKKKFASEAAHILAHLISSPQTHHKSFLKDQITRVKKIT